MGSQGRLPAAYSKPQAAQPQDAQPQAAQPQAAPPQRFTLAVRCAVQATVVNLRELDGICSISNGFHFCLRPQDAAAAPLSSTGMRSVMVRWQASCTAPACMCQRPTACMRLRTATWQKAFEEHARTHHHSSPPLPCRRLPVPDHAGRPGGAHGRVLCLPLPQPGTRRAGATRGRAPTTRTQRR